MKNLVRILSLALVVVMLCATLASCAGPSGTYSADVFGVKTTYKFGAFGKVITTVEALGQSETIEGKYKVDGDKIIFTYEEDGKESTNEAKFEKTDDGIKIGGVDFKKQ